MKALISTTEQKNTGYRVAQVVEDNQTFPVADTMFWIDFPSDLDPALVQIDRCWYDFTDQVIRAIPQPESFSES